MLREVVTRFLAQALRDGIAKAEKSNIHTLDVLPKESEVHLISPGEFHLRIPGVHGPMSTYLRIKVIEEQ